MAATAEKAPKTEKTTKTPRKLAKGSKTAAKGLKIAKGTTEPAKEKASPAKPQGKPVTAKSSLSRSQINILKVLAKFKNGIPRGSLYEKCGGCITNALGNADPARRKYREDTHNRAKSLLTLKYVDIDTVTNDAGHTTALYGITIKGREALAAVK